MAKKRKDKKGRVLRTGESQRKDSVYQYRFTDAHGKRRTIYDSTLNGLREKERQIDKMLDKGIDYDAEKMTVLELVEKSVALKTNLRFTTSNQMKTNVNCISKESFSRKTIGSIKISDAKKWYIEMNKRGLSRRTLANLHSLLKGAFQMAMDEDIILKNPFSFSLSFLPDDSKKRVALTHQEQDAFFSFMESDTIGKKYYDMFYVLLWTGLRVSELCGLTMNDIDLKNGIICVDHQLLYTPERGLYIGPPKTPSGVRKIPMTDEVITAFKRILSQRKVETEFLIDGKAGFIFLNRENRPFRAATVDYKLTNIINRYNKKHPESLMPNVTPHVLRHTFCTNMVHAGMKIKDIQYIMGHATIDMTLNLYSHTDEDHAIKEMKNILHEMEGYDISELPKAKDNQ